LTEVLHNVIRRKTHVQGTSKPHTPSLLSSQSADPYWKIVRKATAPAFSPNNMRYLSLCLMTRMKQLHTLHQKMKVEGSRSQQRKLWQLQCKRSALLTDALQECFWHRCKHGFAAVRIYCSGGRWRPQHGCHPSGKQSQENSALLSLHATQPKLQYTVTVFAADIFAWVGNFAPIFCRPTSYPFLHHRKCTCTMGSCSKNKTRHQAFDWINLAESQFQLVNHICEVSLLTRSDWSPNQDCASVALWPWSILHSSICTI